MKSERSIHLQNFPQNFYEPDFELVKKMDLIKQICSAILSIRKRFNLRARLPLLKVTIVGEGAIQLEEFKKYILEEGNVKKVLFDPNLSREAKTKIEIIFEKAGKKFGKKMGEITKDIKSENWKKLSNGSILVAGEILSPEDFVIKLVPSFEGENYESIGTDFLVILDISTNQELEMEGIARDFVRIVQNQRKEQNFEVNDRITIYYEANEEFEKMLELNQNYIKEQCLIVNFINTKEAQDFIYADLEPAKAMIKLIKN